MKLTLPSARPFLRRAAFALAFTAALASSATATWSIIAVNVRTKQVVVASATCLTNFDLRQFLPVVVVGKGAGCAQSFVDTTGNNRLAIWNGLHNNQPPVQILQVLQQIDPSFQTRQYGIVDLYNPAVSFTGTGAGLAKLGISGMSGEIRYAVQGNVLTGNQVIMDAVAAMLAAPGDLTQRVMAGMEAARALGGDGRCSCSPSFPTSCGVPPPNFAKSAHVGFLIDARLGDSDGVCNASVGCATGSYYLNLNVIGNTFDLDPVIQLGTQYHNWRKAQLGHPDGLESLLVAGAQCLPADGRTSTTVDFRLIDIEGLPITVGGAAVTVTNVSGAPAVTTPSPVVDHGNGSYSFTLTAGTVAGQDEWKITVNDGSRPATLAPFLKLRVDALSDLHCGFDEVSLSRDTLVPFTLNLGSSYAGRRYWLLASASGNQPGIVFSGLHMPLNPDGFFRLAVGRANTPVLPNSYSVLDSTGYAQAGFQTWLSQIAPVLGGRIEFSAIVFSGANQQHTALGGFDVRP